MIADKDTDFVYMSGLLPKAFAAFSDDLSKILRRHNVGFGYLENTKDPWCRDYMPVQMNDGSFVSFTYNPDYLQSSELQETITDPQHVIESIQIKTSKCPLVIDGGNWFACEGRGWLTDKIFKENSSHSRSEVIETIKRYFKVDTLSILPKQPFDVTGHIDGMLYPIDRDKTLIADFSFEKKNYQERLFKSLKGQTFTLVPTGHSNKKNQFGDYTALGCYINFLRVGSLIIVPFYGLPTDKQAVEFYEGTFPECRVETIDATGPAEQGGAIHCLTWNIRKLEE